MYQENDKFKVLAVVDTGETSWILYGMPDFDCSVPGFF